MIEEMDWSDELGSQDKRLAPEQDPAQRLAPDIAALKAAVVQKQQEWVLATVRITLHASELFAPDLIEWWMQQPNKALSGRVPATLIAAGHADKVETLLMGLADGVMG